MADRIYLYDSTLRDGAQTQGVDFSVEDKRQILTQLDDFGMDYVEGGWPGANHTDDEFFADIPPLNHTKITAFGMTRTPSNSAENDPKLNALINTGVKHICIVGKSWDFHVTHALGKTLEENIAMVSESIAYLSTKIDEVMFDAEHFFDGYKANPDYALKVVKAAYDAGARWVILCDTNGGTLTHEITEIIEQVVKVVPGDHLGIHCHNDTDSAVANSIAAVMAGVRQIQGTIGGYGERCGNANLIALIPTLKEKLGFDIGKVGENMAELKTLSDSLDDRLNRPRYKHAAYVGSSAFAHKGGLHVSAVMKNPTAYEHIAPEMVGNERLILVSDQAGRSNIVNRLERLGFDMDVSKDRIDALVDIVKQHENEGYAYDAADASFELLAQEHLGQAMPEFFTVKRFRIIDDRGISGGHALSVLSEATVEIVVDGETVLQVQQGNGPVNALSKALKAALMSHYPQIGQTRLTDYKVRIVTPQKGTEAVTRVQIEMSDDKDNRWTTVGVSENIIDASYHALRDGIKYFIASNA